MELFQVYLAKWIYRILESIYSEWNRKFFSSYVKVHCEYHGVEWQTIFSAYQHQYKQWVKTLYQVTFAFETSTMHMFNSIRVSTLQLFQSNKNNLQSFKFYKWFRCNFKKALSPLWYA